MDTLGLVLLIGPLLLIAYSYLGYPLALMAISREPRTGEETEPADDPDEWPTVSITVPAFNEAAQIRDTLEHLLALEYPRDRLQILVVSDASTDGTDAIVESFADRGIELHRRPVRKGKTAAENAVAPLLTGEIVVNTDASIRIHPGALKALIRRFRDPEVGLASGRDISVAADTDSHNVGESGYVGYEMWIRELETRTGGIVGASGCLYAIRSRLHRTALPGNLSRDFAAALVTRLHGFRAVSVGDATCLVPRTPSLRKEYRRKVRTMIRGIRTLSYERALLDPFRYGLFSWKLFSHKVCRWMSSWALLAGVVGVAVLAASGHRVAQVGLLGALAVGATAGLAWYWPEGPRMPRLLAMAGFSVWSNVAALQAALMAPLGTGSATWEPTRRSSVEGEGSGTADRSVATGGDGRQTTLRAG